MAETTDDAWFLYIVRCADGSLYTGITNNVPRRSKQHNAGTASRYTRSRLPVELVYQESQPSRSMALKRELAVKSKSREEKESLIRLGRQCTFRERIIKIVNGAFTMNKELIQAIDLALAGEWDRAHKAVQVMENETAYWIHALLHKIEGDQNNSRYWYSRAGKMEHFGMDSTAELQLIRKELSGEQK